MVKAGPSRDAQTSVDQRDEHPTRLPKMQPIVNACTVAIFCLFLFGVHALLVVLNARLAALDRTALITFLPRPSHWWAFPAVGAFALSWEFTLQIWSLLGHRATANQYREWAKTAPLVYRGRTFTLSAQGFFQWLTMFVALPLGMYTLLDLNEHTSFNPDSMSVCGLAYQRWETRTYPNLLRITLVQGKIDSNGKYKPSPALVLDFAEEYRWSSARWGFQKASTLGTLATFLSRQADLPIDASATVEGIPATMPR